jgi:hypothetical protein
MVQRSGVGMSVGAADAASEDTDGAGSIGGGSTGLT